MLTPVCLIGRAAVAMEIFSFPMNFCVLATAVEYYCFVHEEYMSVFRLESQTWYLYQWKWSINDILNKRDGRNGTIVVGL